MLRYGGGSHNDAIRSVWFRADADPSRGYDVVAMPSGIGSTLTIDEEIPAWTAQYSGSRPAKWVLGGLLFCGVMRWMPAVQAPASGGQPPAQVAKAGRRSRNDGPGGRQDADRRAPARLGQRPASPARPTRNRCARRSKDVASAVLGGSRDTERCGWSRRRDRALADAAGPDHPPHPRGSR